MQIFYDLSSFKSPNIAPVQQNSDYWLVKET